MWPYCSLIKPVYSLTIALLWPYYYYSLTTVEKTIPTLWTLSGPEGDPGDPGGVLGIKKIIKNHKKL